MAESRNWRKGEKAIIMSGLIGAAMSLITALIVNAVLAWLIAGERVPQSAIGYSSVAVLLVSSVVGAAVSIKSAKCKQMIVSVLGGLIYFLSLLLVTAVFFDGAFKGIAVTAAVIAAGSVCTALIVPGDGKKAHKVGRKKKYR